MIAKLRRPEGPLEGQQSRLQPERLATAITDGSNAHCRPSCLSLMAPERPLQRVEADFFQQNRIRRGGQMAMQRQYTTTALQHWTAKQRRPEENTLGRKSQGQNVQGKTREVPMLGRTTCTTSDG